MKHVVFNEEKSEYYKKKQERLKSDKEDRDIVADHAKFIKYYGMSAFIELFPDAKEMPITWHREIVEEIQRIERKQLAEVLKGISLATPAHKSKKGGRLFRRTIKEMMKD